MIVSTTTTKTPSNEKNTAIFATLVPKEQQQQQQQQQDTGGTRKVLSQAIKVVDHLCNCAYAFQQIKEEHRIEGTCRRDQNWTTKTTTTFPMANTNNPSAAGVMMMSASEAELYKRFLFDEEESFRKCPPPCRDTTIPSSLTKQTRNSITKEDIEKEETIAIARVDSKE